MAQFIDKSNTKRADWRNDVAAGLSLWFIDIFEDGHAYFRRDAENYPRDAGATSELRRASKLF
jgi:hypothetical protein